jgi:dTDP-4-dehydrorhamnose reductase
MTRVLVLGAGGMLGHKLLQRLPRTFETVGSARNLSDRLVAIASKAGARLYSGLEATDMDAVERLTDEVGPQVIVNCVGLIKQRAEGREAVPAIRINALFPHELAAMAAKRRVRVIHLSTDCVFSGDRGRYTENDRADPVDVYGTSKLLGEVNADNALTMRTSTIGRELSGFHSLMEWFLQQPRGGEVKGYTRAIFSGLTTIALADEIARLISDYPKLSGVYHVAADPISKYDLLRLLQVAFGLDISLVPDAAFHCDRSLDASRYTAATKFVPPSWPAMIAEVAADTTPYGLGPTR